MLSRLVSDVSRLVSDVQTSATRTARIAAFGFGASLALVIGLAFLTLSAWLFLVTITTAAITALIIGGFYTGVALVILAVMASNNRAYEREKVRAAAASAEASPFSSAGGADLAGLVAAFVTGMSAGSKARS